MRLRLAAAILCILIGAAQAQTSGGGVTPEGVIVPGNCTRFGTTKYRVADAGAPCGTGSGSVTSVGLSLPTSVFSISGSPVTSAGTLTGAFQTQTANTVFAGPASGGAATPGFRALVAADVPSSILPGSFSGFANPSASVGPTATNGVATTAMRSDAAPAINLTATYPWTGPHSWAPGANTTSITSTTSNTGSNAASGVTFNHTLNTSGSPDVFKIAVTDTARGASTKLFNLYGGAAGTSSLFSIDKDGSLLVAGNLSASTTSKVLTYAIGVFNNGGAGTLSLSGAGTAKLGPTGDDGGFGLSNNALSLTVRASVPANDTFQHGKLDAAAPVAQTVRFQSVVAGTSNTAGVNATFIGSLSTGSGVSGDLIFQTGGTGAGATSQNAATSALALKGATQLVQLMKSYTVGALPTCNAGARGSLTYVTDALAPTYLAALVGGGAVVTPAFCDGANWVGG